MEYLQAPPSSAWEDLLRQFGGNVEQALSYARSKTNVDLPKMPWQSVMDQPYNASPVDLVGHPGRFLQKVANGQRVGPTMTQPMDTDALDFAGAAVPMLSAGKSLGGALVKGVQREILGKVPKVKSSTVSIGGIQFDGPVHGVALNKAKKYYGDHFEYNKADGDFFDGFRLDSGEVVPRKRAEEITGARNSEDMPHGRAYKRVRAQMGSINPSPERTLEFLRGDAERAAAPKVGPKKQAQIDRGLYHGVGAGTLLRKPVSEMSFDKVPGDPMVPRKIISPEDLLGKVIVPLVGDRTQAGQLLRGIDNIPLKGPVKLEGGADYMRTHAQHNAAWASGGNVITGLNNRVRAAMDSGKDVVGVHVAMSPTSGDFSTMSSNTLLQMLHHSPPEPALVGAFDALLQKQFPKKQLPSVLDPAFKDALDSSGPLRLAFAKEMHKQPFSTGGFPDVAAARAAITEPGLLHARTGASGFSIADLNGTINKTPVAPHSSYPVELGGQYRGSFDNLVPRELLLPDFFQRRRRAALPAAADDRSLMMNTPTQLADQQWLDHIMHWQENRPHSVPRPIKKEPYEPPPGLLPGNNIKDWQWKSPQGVKAKLGLDEVPSYITEGYGRFMDEQTRKAARGELGLRDVIKAYGITRSSVNRASRKIADDIASGDARPEGYFSDWLMTKEGKAYLDDAEKGLVNEGSIADIKNRFKPFGMADTLGEDLRYAAETFPKSGGDVNKAVLGSREEWRDYAKAMKGIGPSKAGFIASMLGRGDIPTLDARQLRLHTDGGSAEASKYMRRGGGMGGDEAVDRLARSQSEMQVKLDPSLAPHYQHLTHHAVWDKAGNSKTTHDDIVRAMRLASLLGLGTFGGYAMQDEAYQ